MHRLSWDASAPKVAPHVTTRFIILVSIFGALTARRIDCDLSSQPHAAARQLRTSEEPRFFNSNNPVGSEVYQGLKSCETSRCYGYCWTFVWVGLAKMKYITPASEVVISQIGYPESAPLRTCRLHHTLHQLQLGHARFGHLADKLFKAFKPARDGPAISPVQQFDGVDEGEFGAVLQV